MATSASSCTLSSFLWRGFLACSTRSAAPFLLRSCSLLFASKPLSLYGSPHQVTPLGPGAVVVTHALVTEQVRQDEPRVGRALSYPAIGYYVVPLAEADLSLVDLLQLIGALEGPILPDGSRPWHVSGPWDVPSPQSAFLWVIRHVE